MGAHPGALSDWLKDPGTRSRVPYDLQKAELAVQRFAAFRDAYLKREGTEKTGQELRDALVELSPAVYASATTLDLEVQYNKTQPFVWAWMLYLAAAVATLTVCVEQQGQV